MVIEGEHIDKEVIGPGFVQSLPRNHAVSHATPKTNPTH